MWRDLPRGKEKKCENCFTPHLIYYIYSGSEYVINYLKVVFGV